MAIYTTYADVFRPQEQQKRLAYDAALVVGGSLLIALSAQISVYPGFSPVPITGQTFAVLFLAALLGSRRGAAAVLAYLAEGASGMPVFAGGSGGAAVLAGPTGGYLFGFVIAAYVVGWLSEHGWDRHAFTTALAMVIGNIIIYIVGMTLLNTYMGGWSATVAAGLEPFIIADILKIVLATALLPAGWKYLKNSETPSEN